MYKIPVRVLYVLHLNFYIFSSPILNSNLNGPQPSFIAEKSLKLSQKQVQAGPPGPTGLGGPFKKYNSNKFGPPGVGVVAVKIKTYPFVVSVRQHLNHKCGGIILDDSKILTVAHCFKPNIPLQIYTIHVGRTKKYGVEEMEQVFGIVKTLRHPEYNKDFILNNDIIILKLNASIKFNVKAQPARLPSANEVLPTNSFCCMVGWGETFGYGNPNLLNEGCFPSWTNEKCNSKNFHDGKISPNMLCAGEEFGGIDSCHGDSGGPLFCNVCGTKKVWGLVSWGVGCAHPNKPGVYVNLAKYRNWIEQNLKF